MSSEYLLRVKPASDGGFSASIRRFAGTAHPEVRAVVGPVAFGHGATEPAAMLAAIANARLPEVHEVPDVS
jgi:hypothetical protein